MKHKTESLRPAAASEKNTQLERLVFFSDAVIAIAITLLALDLRLPDMSREMSEPELLSQLLDSAPRILSYVISFALIGLFWVSHHRMFGLIRGYTPQLIWLNLLLLMSIAFLPFPTGLLGSYGAYRTGVVFYALSLMLVGLLQALLWRYASSGHRLIDPHLAPEVVRANQVRPLVPTLVGAIVIIVAFWEPTIANLFWLLSLPLSFMTRRNLE